MNFWRYVCLGLLTLILYTSLLFGRHLNNGSNIAISAALENFPALFFYFRATSNSAVVTPDSMLKDFPRQCSENCVMPGIKP